MTDIFSPAQRSIAMSKVGSRDTKPEWILRSGLHRLGFRYRLGNRHLAGKPDLLFPKYRAVVFVHGCYWHRHPGCKDATTPKSNTDFWIRKFAENIERDRRTEEKLAAEGWRVMVVWECELLKETLQAVRRVSRWLTQETTAALESSGDESVIDRAQLLTVAERRVRYRICSNNKPHTNLPKGEKGDE